MQIASRGMIWMTAATMGCRVIGFLAQWILGWLLAKEEFGVWAITLGISALAGALRDGGIEKILIQRGREFDLIARSLTHIACGFRIVGGLMICVIGAMAAQWYQAPQIVWLSIIIAISNLFLITTWTLRSKLSIELKFGKIASIDASANLFRHIVTIITAVAGLGPMSLALGQLADRIAGSIIYQIVAGPMPQANVSICRLLPETLRVSRWIVLMGVGLALSRQGDYLIVGAIAGERILGIYFFGFQLTTTMWILFESGLRSVMMPSLASLQHDSGRQRHAFHKAMRVLAFVGTPASVVLALVAEPVISLLWAGRWDETIPVVQLLAIAMIFRLLSPLGSALIESQGRWHIQAILLILDTIGVFAAAAIGSIFGDVAPIAGAIAVHQIVVSLTTCIVASRYVALPTRDVLIAIAKPSVVAIPVGFLLWMLPKMLTANIPEWGLALLQPGLFLAIYLAAAAYLLRVPLLEARAMLRL